MIANVVIIGGIVICIILGGLCIGAESGDTKSIIIGLLVGIIISTIIVGADIWYINGTESGKRMKKDLESNTNGGIERTVKVYDINGKLIETYEGNFDIDYYDTHIKFDDEEGKRHIIYFTTGTIITDEK